MPIRRRLVVTAMVVGVTLVLAVLIARFIGSGSTIHDAATLPAQISVCGREWIKHDLGRVLSLSAARARDGVEPVVVDPGPLAACPAGPCSDAAEAAPCDTIVYVRVGEDAYLDYALQGGP